MTVYYNAKVDQRPVHSEGYFYSVTVIVSYFVSRELYFGFKQSFDKILLLHFFS